MSTHFYGSDFFSGDFFGQQLVIIDTHDGGDRKRHDEKLRQASDRRRQQITDAFDPPGAVDARAPIPDAAPSASPGIAFDFDADDEEIILLL